jgi:hypothetical protein
VLWWEGLKKMERDGIEIVKKESEKEGKNKEKWKEV